MSAAIPNDPGEAMRAYLAEHEDDELARAQYADWLEENGQDDEAGRQREWPMAKARLREMCERGSRGYWDSDDSDDGNDDDYYTMSYPRLMRLAGEAAERDDYSFNCGASEGVQDELNANRAQFWRDWSIVTGIPVPPDVEDRGYFSCSC
jgi:uncharacterized protein (TIGR02996 family)